MKLLRIKRDWFDAGKLVEQLGEPIFVGGQYWTPIRFLKDEDPDFLKSACLEEE